MDNSDEENQIFSIDETGMSNNGVAADETNRRRRQHQNIKKRNVRCHQEETKKEEGEVEAAFSLDSSNNFSATVPSSRGHFSNSKTTTKKQEQSNEQNDLRNGHYLMRLNDEEDVRATPRRLEPRNIHHRHHRHHTDEHGGVIMNNNNVDHPSDSSLNIPDEQPLLWAGTEHDNRDSGSVVSSLGSMNYHRDPHRGGETRGAKDDDDRSLSSIDEFIEDDDELIQEASSWGRTVITAGAALLCRMCMRRDEEQITDGGEEHIEDIEEAAARFDDAATHITNETKSTAADGIYNQGGGPPGTEAQPTPTTAPHPQQM